MKNYTPPADKSITIRALLLAAMARGCARIENPLRCQDTKAALACLTALGVKTARVGKTLLVTGTGPEGLRQPAAPLNAGESGALARLLAGILVGQPFTSVITGRGSLLKRPMRPLAEVLGKLGARISAKNGRLPLSIKPAELLGAKVGGIESAQVKSALLLATLQATGPSEIKEKFQTRDHTERLLALMGAAIWLAPRRTNLAPGPLTSRPITVPGDISSAAPFIAAALLSGQPLSVTACGLNPARLGFVRALQKMGAKITLTVGGTFPEPEGRLEVAPSKLKGIRVAPAEIPALIDEVPLLAVVAARAKGKTIINGIEGLRAKESDRIASTLALLAALGVKASYKKGSLTITGQEELKATGSVNTFNDHRIAMAAAAASAACPGLKIKNPGCVNKSYPGFWHDFKNIFKAL